MGSNNGVKLNDNTQLRPCNEYWMGIMGSTKNYIRVNELLVKAWRESRDAVLALSLVVKRYEKNDTEH